MGMHPNTILLVALTPEGLARKTMKDILGELGVETDLDVDVVINGETYHHEIAEGDYHEGWQIKSKEGDLLFFDYVTYGYGASVTWDKLAKQKRGLEAWAIDVCKRHNCAYEIRVCANFW